MKLFKKNKLNQEGFSHHLILPVLVMVAVAAIGVYLLNGSKAAELPKNSSVASVANPNSCVDNACTKIGNWEAESKNTQMKADTTALQHHNGYAVIGQDIAGRGTIAQRVTQELRYLGHIRQ